MISAIHKLGRALLITFALIAITLGYWSVIMRDSLLAREDNPRLVLDEQRIQRGAILDRDGEVLAESRLDPQTGLVERLYPSPSAAPAIGYYSIRHGVGGIEAAYDPLLRGEQSMTPFDWIWNDALHRPQIGGDVQLTIDDALQAEADRLLADHSGAIVLIRVPQGEVLAMMSHPTYDPNELDRNWDRLFDDPSAPLLNRTTQGLYQPGTILQSIILGAALDSGISPDEHPWQNQLFATIDDTRLPCAAIPAAPVTNLADAYLWGCPAPFENLASMVGTRRLDAVIGGFGLLEAPLFELPTEPSEVIPPPAQQDLSLTAIGQSQLTVSPLQMAQVAAGFANHGEIPALRIVRSIRVQGGEWQPVPPVNSPRGTISRTNADAISLLMLQSVERGASRSAQLPNLRIYGHSGLAVAGPQGTLHSWFIGFVQLPASGQAVAISVLLEDESDASIAAEIGALALQAAAESLP